MQNCFTALHTKEEKPIASGEMLGLSKVMRISSLCNDQRNEEKVVGDSGRRLSSSERYGGTRLLT